jgi:hypothetical protein
MREWLDQHVPGVSTEVKTFLDQATSGWYGLDMAGLSALNWMDYLVIPYPGGDERWHVKHGNDQVPALAAKALPAGTVQLESPLQALIKRPDGSYELRFGGSAPSRPVIADHVILTIPWTTLREVDLESAGLSSYRMTAIRELGMGTDVKLIVQYNRRPAKFKVHGRPWSGTVNYTNPNYQTWDSAPTEPGTAGLITVYAGGSGSKPFASPGYHAPAPQDLTATVLGQINQAVPGTKAQFNGKAWLDYWTGDPWTRGSYAAYIPGQVTKYWGYAGIPEGRVHFAGEHTSTYSQGFLNGGVESGQRAAIEVLLALASRCRPVLPRCRTRGYPASTSELVTAGNGGIRRPPAGHPGRCHRRVLACRDAAGEDTGLMRVVVTRIEWDGTMRRRLVDTAGRSDASQWEGLVARALAIRPLYRPVPEGPLYHVQVDDWAVLVAEDDLSGPLSDLVTAVLAMGETRLWPGAVTVVTGADGRKRTN